MAKIDTSKIEGYASMSVEDKIKALEALEYDDNAAELERLRKANDKLSSESAEWKRKHNALLSEEEKKKQELRKGELEKQCETVREFFLYLDAEEGKSLLRRAGGILPDE